MNIKISRTSLLAPHRGLAQRIRVQSSCLLPAMAVAPLALLMTAPLTTPAAQAQSTQWRTENAQSQPRRTTSNKKQAKSQSQSASGGDLAQRVEQLEEQIVDLQVVIGTVESLAKSGGGQSASYGRPTGAATLSGPDAGRIAALETQVQAMTSQIEQMAAEIRALRGGGAGASPPAPPSGGWRPQAGGYNSNPVTSSRDGFGAPPLAPGQDPIGNLISSGGSADDRGRGEASPGARQSYERAYGQLLQQNYAAAEAGFADFLRQYPNDEMAANAQFWLGETHFVRGQWDAAAAAFLKVAQQHTRSAKAPDSLAKLAMAMERKGNRNAACRALAELNARYPNPPAYVKKWEKAERRRAGCA